MSTIERNASEEMMWAAYGILYEGKKLNDVIQELDAKGIRTTPDAIELLVASLYFSKYQ